ncbi:MAG TPA: hypothetical protein ENK02_04665 [Planctomycetes bacterium]|nr:hypothetical protein [Planctomycetota bacterium]
MSFRVLVDFRGPWGLGDLVCAEPMLRGLREFHGPRAEIRIRGHAGNCAYSPAIDGQAPPDFRPDRVVPVRLFTELGQRAYAALEALPSLVDHLCAYAAHFPQNRTPMLHLGPSERELAQRLGVKELRHPIVALCADGSDPFRALPLGHFQALGKEVLARGGSLIELGARERLGLGHDLVGKLPIRAAAAVLEHCDLFIGNNSGLLHYAQGADCPVLGFFSLALPERFIHEGRLVVAVQHPGLSCLDCMTRDFEGRNARGCTAQPEAACMRTFPLQTAQDALARVFDEYLSQRPWLGRDLAFGRSVLESQVRRLRAQGFHERADRMIAAWSKIQTPRSSREPCFSNGKTGSF